MKPKVKFLNFKFKSSTFFFVFFLIFAIQSWKECFCFMKSKTFDFTLMSYNVLNQDMLESNPHLYTDCDPLHLQWEQRRERILNEIVREQPDLLCLQEVHPDHYHSFYVPSLKQHGYEGVYEQKNDTKDGCATFYKMSLFRLKQCVGLNYKRPEINLILDRDYVAQICVFNPLTVDSPNEPKNSIVIVNTHLLWDPKRGDVKLAQLRVLFAEMHRIEREQSNYGRSGQATCTILCGDLNAAAKSPLCQFIESGSIKIDDKLSLAEVSGQLSNYTDNRTTLNSESLQMVGIDKDGKWIDLTSASDTNQLISNSSKFTVRHPFKFLSAYPARNKAGVDFMTTEMSPDYFGLVDHIYYTKDTGLHVHSLRQVLTIPEFKQSVRAIPNQDFGSDHLSLVARFELKIKN